MTSWLQRFQMEKRYVNYVMTDQAIPTNEKDILIDAAGLLTDYDYKTLSDDKFREMLSEVKSVKGIIAIQALTVVLNP